MLAEGLVEQGLLVTRAVHERYRPGKRNPYNEIECGDHYARAMASYGLLQAYAGSHLDLSRGRIRLAPRAGRDAFAVFFSVEGAWGSVRLAGDRVKMAGRAVTVLRGELVV
jgi:hypothetical protein